MLVGGGSAENGTEKGACCADPFLQQRNLQQRVRRRGPDGFRPIHLLGDGDNQVGLGAALEQVEDVGCVSSNDSLEQGDGAVLVARQRNPRRAGGTVEKTGARDEVLSCVDEALLGLGCLLCILERLGHKHVSVPRFRLLEHVLQIWNLDLPVLLPSALSILLVSPILDRHESQHLETIREGDSLNIHFRTHLGHVGGDAVPCPKLASSAVAGWQGAQKQVQGRHPAAASRDSMLSLRLDGLPQLRD
eukprot:3191158-Rhodomonas_salina.1